MGDRRGESPASGRRLESPATARQNGYDRSSLSLELADEIPERKGSNEVLDLLTLIADFLDRSTHLKKTVTTLRSEVVEMGLMPTIIGWDGTPHAGRLPDFRSLRALPSDHLLRLFDALKTGSHANPEAGISHEKANASGLLTQTMHRFNGASIRPNHEHLLSQTGAKTKPAQQLIEFRMEQRQLIRELKADRGRSTGSLNAALKSVTTAISQISRTLALTSTFRKQIGRNALDVLISPAKSEHTASDTTISRIMISRLRTLKKITGHRAPAYCASSSHSKWIFTAADDCVIKMWNGETARAHYAFRGHKNVITDLASTDELIASASEDNTVRVWEIGSTRPFVVFTQHRQPVQRVQFSPDGSLLFTSAEDGACCVWNMDSLRMQVRERDLQSEVWRGNELERRRHAALNQQQNQGPPTIALTREQEETQLLIDCPRQPLIFDPPLVFPHCEKQGTVAKIVCMAVHPSGKYVATGSEDRLGRVWSVDDVTAVPPPPVAETMPNLIQGEYRDGADHLLCTLSGHTEGFVHHIEWSHKGDRILTFSDKDGTARIWFWPLGDFASKPQHIALKTIGANAAKGGAPRSSARNAPVVDSAGFSRNDSFVITTQSVKPSLYKDEEPGFWDSRVCVWDTKSGNLLRFIRGHRAQAHVLRMHPELDWVAATCGADGLIIFWDILKGEQISRVEAISTEGFPSILDARWAVGQSHPGEFIATDSMGRLLIIGSGDGGSYAASPCQQFFSNERNDFFLDPRTNEPVDSTVQVPLYLMRPPPAVVNVHEERYTHQPRPVEKGQGSFFEPPLVGVYANRSTLIAQATEMQRIISNEEDRALQDKVFKDSIQKQDEKIQLEIQKDLEEQAGTVPGVRPNGGSSVTRSQKVIKPKTQKTQPMLALERATLEEEDESDTDDEDDKQEESDRVNGRTRRAAARRANAQIHRHARFFESEAPSRNEENDPTFVEGAGRRRHSADDDEDDEEEISDYDSDEDDEEDDYGRRRPSEVFRPTRSYELRGRRRNYSELDNDDEVENGYDRGRSPDDDEDDDDLSEPRARKTKSGSARPSGLAPTQAAAHSEALYSSEWLTFPTETASYVPQKGDRVVYFPQGHAEYLRNFPSTDSPPWQAWNVKEWPYVGCSVEEVDYVFPEKDEPHQILCKVHLRIDKVKAPIGSGQHFLPFPDQKSPVTFTVLYHSFEFEFLVLLERFLVGLRPVFTVGASVRFFIHNEDNPADPHPCKAIIKAINVKDPEEWPDSPWEALVCETGDLSPGEVSSIFISPWDAEVEGSSEVPLWRIVSNDTLSFRDLEVESKNIQVWIADEIDSCPLWSAFFRVRKHPSLPCPISIGLVTERLRNGKFYRQWDSIAADFRRVVECATTGKPEGHPMQVKAIRFQTELTEILRFAQLGERAEQVSSSVSSIDAEFLKKVVSDSLDLVAAADKEGFFANPVDLQELPDYLEHISQPMDFSTIRERIDNFSFRTAGGSRVSLPAARRFLRSVVRDVRQISMNAMTYNLEGTVAFRRGKDVLKEVGKVFGEIDLDGFEKSRSREGSRRSSRQIDNDSSGQHGGEEEAKFSSRGRRVRSVIPSYNEVENDDADSLLQTFNDDDDDDDLEEDHDGSSDEDFGGKRGSKKRRHSRGGKRGRPRRVDPTPRQQNQTQVSSRASQRLAHSQPHTLNASPSKSRISSRRTHQQELSPIPVSDAASTRISQRVKRVRISLPQEDPSMNENEILERDLEEPFESRGSARSGGRGRRAVPSSSSSLAAKDTSIESSAASRPRRSIRRTTDYSSLGNTGDENSAEESYSPQPTKRRGRPSKVKEPIAIVESRPTRRARAKVSYAEDDDAEDIDEGSDDEWMNAAKSSSDDEGQSSRRRSSRSRRS